MNLSLIFVVLIVFLLGELIKITVSILQLPNDSPERKKQLLQFSQKKISEEVSYRYHAEESARIKAFNRQMDLESFTGDEYTTTEPREEGKAKRLWQEAEKALDDYNKSKKGS